MHSIYKLLKHKTILVSNATLFFWWYAVLAPFSLLREESRTKVGLQLSHLLYKYRHLLFQKDGEGGGGGNFLFL